MDLDVRVSLDARQGGASRLRAAVEVVRAAEALPRGLSAGVVAGAVSDALRAVSHLTGAGWALAILAEAAVRLDPSEGLTHTEGDFVRAARDYLRTRTED